MFAAIKTFTAPAAAGAARCESCGAAIAADHAHLYSLDTLTLRCACPSCAARHAIGAGERPDVVALRRRAERVTLLTPEIGAETGAPLELAFLVRRSDGRLIAFFPGPTGLAASELSPSARLDAAWAPEIEALLVYRGAQYLVSIDRCFELAGLIRDRWSGWGGGGVFASIDAFFEALDV